MERLRLFFAIGKMHETAVFKNSKWYRFLSSWKTRNAVQNE